MACGTTILIIIFCLYFFGGSRGTAAQSVISNQTDGKSKQTGPPARTNGDPAIRATIEAYVRFANEQNYSELKKITSKIDVYEMFSFDENKEAKDPIESSNSKRGEEVNAAPIEDALYEALTRDIPDRIGKKQLIVLNLDDLIIKGQRAMVKVKLSKKSGGSWITRQDYYLIRTKTGKWHIYRIVERLGTSTVNEIRI